MHPPRSPEATARINDRVRELSYPDTDDPIAFFCECGDASCFRPVWLAAAEFDRERALGRPLVVAHGARRPAAA